MCARVCRRIRWLASPSVPSVRSLYSHTDSDSSACAPLPARACFGWFCERALSRGRRPGGMKRPGAGGGGLRAAPAPHLSARPPACLLLAPPAAGASFAGAARSTRGCWCGRFWSGYPSPHYAPRGRRRGARRRRTRAARPPAPLHILPSARARAPPCTWPATRASAPRRLRARAAERARRGICFFSFASSVGNTSHQRSGAGRLPPSPPAPHTARPQRVFGASVVVVRGRRRRGVQAPPKRGRFARHVRSAVSVTLGRARSVRGFRRAARQDALAPLPPRPPPPPPAAPAGCWCHWRQLR